MRLRAQERDQRLVYHTDRPALSLCDYGRKNETEIREVERLTVDDSSTLESRIDAEASAEEKVRHAWVKA